MTRMEPVGAFGDGVLETCGRCRREKACETVEILVRREAFYSPAEYDEVPMCADCLELVAYLSDPDNAAYERAIARGWRD